MNDLDPYRNLETDLREAIAEIFPDERLSAFIEDRRAAIPLDEALRIAEQGYRPFLEARSLVGLPMPEVHAHLSEVKGVAWADLALSWLRMSIPAVIFVRIISGVLPEYLLGDGHHRLALAGALGHSAIHAVFVGLRLPREHAT